MTVEDQISHPVLSKVVGWRLLGKSPTSFYLRLNRWVWRRLPSRLWGLNLVRSYGTWLHTLVRLRSQRRQFFGTFFLRNRPELELIRRLAEQKPQGSTLKIAVLGCSIGAEVYSIAWILRSTRPDLDINFCAVDISKEILNFAARGVYAPNTSELVGASVFTRLTAAEKKQLFDWKDDQATVKASLREGITWHVGDATDPGLVQVIGPQDMVVASNFLCHMPAEDAEKCLRNLPRLVSPGGYLFVSGVDLDVRTKVAVELGWKPVPDLLQDIHEGDPCVRADWPWEWWGLEPLNHRRLDWQIRYAAAFQVNKPGGKLNLL